MAVPSTIDEFVELIRKSGLVEDASLDAYLQQLRGNGVVAESLNILAGWMVRDRILTYFWAEQLVLGKWRGFTIGNYKLLERLGFGDGGTVYLCEHLLSHRKVAVKVLPPALADNPSSLRRFYLEARIGAALDHPNIVRMHDIDQDGSLHFIVQEYIDGGDLRATVRGSGRLDPERACSYIWQAARGLDQLFQTGVVHRSICPENLVVARHGVVKIIDFGLGRLLCDDVTPHLHSDESMLGIPDYAAPEQCIDDRSVDIRADIYGLGCTFYFLLSGNAPFPDGTIAQKLIWHQAKYPQPIPTLRPDVPEAVIAVLTKMMAKSPEDRFQTPNEVCEALSPFVDGPIPPPDTGRHF